MIAIGGMPANPLAALFYGPCFWIGCGLFLVSLYVTARTSWRLHEQRRRTTRYTDRGPVAPLEPHQLCSRWICYDRPDRGPCPGMRP